MKILFLGDLYYDYDFMTEDIKNIIEYIKFKNYKVVLNLESTIENIGKPIKKRGPNLKSSDCLIDILKEMNCIAVCMANNHTMDFGEESLKATIIKLNENGIACVGAGINLNEACKPILISDAKRDIFIQNFGWDIEETIYAKKTTAGCAPLYRNIIINSTEKIKKNFPNSIIINVFHWGFEYNTLPMPLDIGFAHSCIEKGCNLIIGHHPHVIQPIEEYNGGRIFYSLGNFYFGSRRNGFNLSYKNEKYVNYGDYGLGVIFDTDSLHTKLLMIVYDREKEKTYFEEKMRDGLVQDLDLYDWKGKNYIRQVKTHSYKHNPILDLDNGKNYLRLKTLMFEYWLANKFQFIKKSKLGYRLYEYIKKTLHDM